MTEYYEKMLDYGQDFLFNIAFHPYYRTAKFAQRESKCEKAIKYYKKAMQFYSESEQESEKKKILSQLNYEIATVYTYIHEYEKGSFFIQRSFACDKTQNPQRNYVLAILCALGEKQDGSNWKIGIENPDRDSSQAYIRKVNVKDACVVTSGDYQRYYVVDGKQYRHIIDPVTLMPSEGYVSVSVVCWYPFR